MANKIPLPLNQIEGVAAGSTATITLPRNVRYHAVFLEYDTSTAGGATESNMETELPQIRVNLNDVTQRKFSASQLFDVNRTKGLTPEVGDGTLFGYLPILFSEPQRETKGEKEFSAWGMDGVGSFDIEVDIFDNSSQTPTLKAWAIVDEVIEAPKGIVKWKTGTLTINTTGENEFNLVSEKGDSIQGLHFFENTAGDINDLLIEKDGKRMWKLTEGRYTALMSQYMDGLSKVSGNYYVPFDFNHPDDVLTMVTEKRVNNNVQRFKTQEVLATLDMANAASVTLLSEMVGIPD